MIKGTSVSSLKTKKNASKNKVKKHTKKPVPHIQAETLLQAAELSKAFKNMARYPYRATAILTGYPKIRPFDPISVTDLPDESLNGVWVVLSVKHQFNVSGAAAYQMECDLGSNDKLLSYKVRLQSGNTSSQGGPSTSQGGKYLTDEMTRSSSSIDSAFSLEDTSEISMSSVKSQAWLSLVNYEDNDLGQNYTAASYLDLDPVNTFEPEFADSLAAASMKIFRQEDTPRKPLLGEFWYKPSTKTLYVGYKGSWTAVVTSSNPVTSGTSSSDLVVIDLNDSAVYANVSGVLRKVSFANYKPNDLVQNVELRVIPAAVSISWNVTVSTWYLWGSTGWETVSTVPDHYPISEAVLSGLDFMRSLGWLLSPRGLEPGVGVLNVDPYFDEIPNIDMGALTLSYWTNSGEDGNDAQENLLPVPAWTYEGISYPSVESLLEEN